VDKDDGGAGCGASQTATSGYTKTSAEAGDTDTGSDLDEDSAQTACQDTQCSRVDHLDRRVRHPAQRYCLRALARTTHTAGRGDREDCPEANSQYRLFIDFLEASHVTRSSWHEIFLNGDFRFLRGKNLISCRWNLLCSFSVFCFYFFLRLY